MQETNTPGAEETQLFSELEKPTEQKSASSEVLPKFDFSPDPEGTGENKTTVDTTANTSEKKDTAILSSDKKVTPDDANVSGVTAAMLIDTLTNLAFGIGVKLQTKNKFSEEQRERISSTDILDAREETLNESDYKLKQYWKRVMSSQKKKFDALESDDKDIERRSKILSKYFKETNTQISAGWLVVAALIEDIGGKAEAIFLGD